MRLIDADFEIEHWESVLINPTPDVTEKDRRTAPYIIDALKMAGTVKDAVEVVRCKDCIYSDWYKTIEGKDLCYCMVHGNHGHKETGFCSDGDRETDG